MPSTGCKAAGDTETKERLNQSSRKRRSMSGLKVCTCFENAFPNLANTNPNATNENGSKKMFPTQVGTGRKTITVLTGFSPSVIHLDRPLSIGVSPTFKRTKRQVSWRSVQEVVSDSQSVESILSGLPFMAAPYASADTSTDLIAWHTSQAPDSEVCLERRDAVAVLRRRGKPEVGSCSLAWIRLAGRSEREDVYD